MPPEIFASYSREDQAEVFLIVDKLRERGLNIWIDQEGIHGAKLWSQEIVNAIEGSKVFILFASAKAFLSKNVTKELALASESDKHILPIFIEDAEIPAAMKYQLAGIQHLVHEQGQTDQTVDNILRTLGNLDIQSAEPQPTAVTPPPAATKSASKTPLVAVALVVALAVIAFLLFRGDRSNEPSTSIFATEKKTYKSTTDLCIVTVHNSGGTKEVFEGNRELRDELDSKLSRFKDYKVQEAKAVSPDATTQELLAVAKELDTEYVLRVTINSDEKRINTKLLNVQDGRNFWSKTLRESDVESDGDFIDEATGLIAAHIAGHDGAIHRDILAKALVKKEEDLTPVELLQLGKNVWEEQTEDVTVKGTRYLEKCIELNPDISTAHAILSEVYLEDVRADYNLIPDAMQKAKESVSRSIELNPSNAIALIEQIWISWYEKDFTACKLQAEAAIKANPYEPLVLVSVGSFYLSTGIDLKLGKEYNDLALKHNETPQGWYYVGYINYYIANNDNKKALEYALKSGTHTNGNHMARASALYWVNDQKDTAIKYYKELITKYPEYTLDTLQRSQDVWSRAEESKNLIQNAFKEVEESAKKLKAAGK
ncbi:TIR domain-containing protein [Verrucomicrobia bacterium]|nr:TIR domain-containing protein [Verrucomicrobiota bacterium]